MRRRLQAVAPVRKYAQYCTREKLRDHGRHRRHSGESLGCHDRRREVAGVDAVHVEREATRFRGAARRESCADKAAEARAYNHDNHSHRAGQVFHVENKGAGTGSDSDAHHYSPGKGIAGSSVAVFRWISGRNNWAGNPKSQRALHRVRSGRPQEAERASAGHCTPALTIRQIFFSRLSIFDGAIRRICRSALTGTKPEID